MENKAVFSAPQRVVNVIRAAPSATEPPSGMFARTCLDARAEENFRHQRRAYPLKSELLCRLTMARRSYLSQADVELVRSLYDAFESKDLDGVIGLLADDMVAHVAPGVPWSGSYYGPE